MVKRIDFFLPPKSQYGVLQHFTKKLMESFERKGVSCRLLVAQRDDPRPFLEQLFKDPPDCTFSINGLLPDEEDRFFSDMIRIPHVAYLVDAAHCFLSMAKSNYTILACADLTSADFFRGMKAPHVLFLPHGVEQELTTNPNEDRPYDVTLLASCLDYEGIREQWHERYPEALCNVLENAAEIALSDQETSYVKALVRAIDQQAKGRGAIDPKNLDFISLLDDLEVYIRGKDRVGLINSIKDAQVHIFGSPNENADWAKYIDPNAKNFTIHESVPYEQAIEIMRQSKILLNSCPSIKIGGHERIFSGLACGALVMASENPYLRSYFEDGVDILFYHHNRLEDVNQKINEYIHDDKKRQLTAAKGREVVMKEHTWDQRVAALLVELGKILPNFKATAG